MPTQPTQQPTLPQELVNTIIHLISRDKACLKACTLVAQSWTRPCREYLFKNLNIDLMRIRRLNVGTLHGRSLEAIRKKQTELHATHLDVLSEALSRAPYLHSYIHHLTITPCPNTGNTEPMDKDLAQSLTLVLNQIDSLRSICFNPGWSVSYPPDLMSAFQTLFKSCPFLSCVKINNGTTPHMDLACLVSGLTNVSTLHLNGDILWNDRESPSLQTLRDDISLSVYPPPATLKTIHIRNINMVYFLILWYKTLAPAEILVESLSIDRYIDDWTSIQSLIDLVSHSLRIIELHGPKHGIYGSLPLAHRSSLNISNVSSLREVKLHAIAMEQFIPVPWILSIFSSAPISLPLRSIDLDLKYVEGYEMSPDYAPHYWEPWLQLDYLLSGPQFPNLKAFTIRFTDSLRPRDTGIPLLRQNLPGLHKRKILVILDNNT